MKTYGDKLLSYWRCFQSEINKKTLLSVIWVYANCLGQPCYPPFARPVDLRPTLTGCLLFSQDIFV